MHPHKDFIRNRQITGCQLGYLSTFFFFSPNLLSRAWSLFLEMIDSRGFISRNLCWPFHKVLKQKGTKKNSFCSRSSRVWRNLNNRFLFFFVWFHHKKKPKFVDELECLFLDLLCCHQPWCEGRFENQSFSFRCFQKKKFLKISAKRIFSKILHIEFCGCNSKSKRKQRWLMMQFSRSF